MRGRLAHFGLTITIAITIIIFTVTLLVLLYHNKGTNRRIEVVVSRYNEDLKWLQKPEFDDVDITVYNNSPNAPDTYGRRCTVINLDKPTQRGQVRSHVFAPHHLEARDPG